MKNPKHVENIICPVFKTKFKLKTNKNKQRAQKATM